MTLLEGVRVVDLSHGPAAGLATMILADFGAEVVKVEPPGGDPFRDLCTAPMWLRGKKTWTLDPANVKDRAKLHRLTAASDVVVSTTRHARAAANGVDYTTLSALNPRLVYCQFTSFGEDGPDLPLYEGVVAAKVGRMMAFQGLAHRPGPAFSALQVGTHAAAMNITSGILAALIERDQSGRGQLLQTSLMQAFKTYDQSRFPAVQVAPDLQTSGVQAVSQQDPFSAKPTLLYQPAQTADGRWLQMGNLLPHHFNRFMELTGLADDRAADGLTAPPDQWPEEARERYRDKILLRIQEWTLADWMTVFVADGGVIAHYYQHTEDALDDPDMLANGHVVDINGVRQLGPVATLTQTPAQISQGETAFDDATLDDLAPLPPGAEGRHGEGPLAGVTVVEFATIIAAPFGASLLADMGARIIKVEPLDGDLYRVRRGGMGALRVNQGKESICIDLKSDEGQAIAGDLMARADIVIHNYRPGVPERLGIGFEAAKRRNPDIVYLSANGYGPKGPGAKRPSSHPIPGAAMGGALYQSGRSISEPLLDLDELRETTRRLMLANEVNPDPNTSMVVCTAALLGLYGKRVRGQGQKIFVDMFLANAYANFDDFVAYPGKRSDRPGLGPDLRGPDPLYQLYPAKTGWVFLGLRHDAEWRSFAAMANKALAGHKDYATTAARTANADALRDALAALFKTETAETWEQRATPLGLGCVVADAHGPSEFWLARKDDKRYMRASHNELTGPYYRHGPMVEFEFPKADFQTAPRAGAHTMAILTELGYDDSRIEQLLRDDHARASGARI
ncbi:MAG: CoA transferase [Rhodospirillaceae bacterium]|jgi:crotonobetainyl-CoA:carnitine CoA-transferase CaiB-like acyl-CoA transferase|nr:CoA transferase [Rhodospirillaceae bacterium]MBT5811262.1 CoA transferase [Rhodospirillaceae bacterium]